MTSTLSEIPEEGNNAAAVYQLIHDQLQGDGQPAMNLASFVTTWMDEEAQQLAAESINKNLINAAEYPQTELIHQRVVEMIAHLFHANVFHANAPRHDEAEQAGSPYPGFIGTTTVGSSEAVMLALLAHKWNWKKARKARAHASFKDQPYLIIGTHTHACFAKFARYFEVGVKWICLEAGQYAISAEQVRAILTTKIVDDPQIMEECGYSVEEAGERTVAELVMAVGCVVGTTYTGDLDDVEGIDLLLTQGGWDIPIHVDGASGGFVLPFSQDDGDENAPLWDFRLPHVKSINVSNHKFGLVYPGLGTVIFRDATIVPKELLMDINYLSGEMVNYSLNFSRASSGVILQYYNFLRLGRDGYRRMIQACLDQAHTLAQAFQSSPALQPYFEVISKTHLFPVVVFRFKDFWSDRLPFTLNDVAAALKLKGWIVPVYPLPANAGEIEVMRIVVRAHFTPELASAFLRDLEAAIEQLMGSRTAAMRFDERGDTMKTLQNSNEIRDFFRTNQTPIYYASTSTFNLIGAEQSINNLTFINAVNSFNGQHPHVFVPKDIPSDLRGIEETNRYLLQHKAVADHLRRSGGGGLMLFLMFDEETEALAQQMGLRVAFPPAKVRRHLDSKVTTTRLANRAGIPSVPNVLARVESYGDLRQVAKALGPDLVVQLPYGDSGNTTYFISSEDDFRRHARQIAGQPTVKIMRRIHCRQATIEGCVTRHGVLVGPLMSEIIGFPELTPYRGGWCGNELFGRASATFSPEHRRQAHHAALAIGAQLKGEGYWGYFGLDFLIDEESGLFYLGELNPRITGATPLTSQAALDRQMPSLLHYHLLEALGVEYRLDVAQFNRQWLMAEQLPSWSQMIIEHTRDAVETIAEVPPYGIWRMAADGALHFARPALQAQAVAGESEALFLPTIDTGSEVAKGSSIGRLITRGRLLTDEYQLNERAAAWIKGIRTHFATQAMPALPVYA